MCRSKKQLMSIKSGPLRQFRRFQLLGTIGECQYPTTVDAQWHNAFAKTNESIATEVHVIENNNNNNNNNNKNVV